jgi:hypothetical protein
MSSLAISPQQQKVLDVITRRMDALDAAAGPSVSRILAAADRLPAADRIAVHQRLMSIGSPDTRWASALDDHR